MREKKYRYTIIDKDVHGAIGTTPYITRNLHEHIHGYKTWVACVDNRNNTVVSIMCYDTIAEMYRYLTFRTCTSKGNVIEGMRVYANDAISTLTGVFKLSLADKIKEVLRID